MNFNLSEEQQMLRDSAERYLRENYDFETRRKRQETDKSFSAECWKDFAELGWLALEVSEEFGGLGCSVIETVTLTEELGRFLVLEPYITNAVLCSRIISRAQNSEVSGELLPRLAEGSLLLALAHAEPGVRYELSAVAKTVGKKIGDGFVLEGVKTLVLDAPVANKLLVSAVVEGEEGFSLFVVDSDAPGVTVKPYNLIDGTRAADVELSAVAVAAAARIAGADSALDLVEEAVDRATLARVAAALGAMEMVMDMTAEYLKTRVQFGQAIGKFQALQHRMSEMFVEVQETRSALYRGLAYIDGEPGQRKSAVSVAKVVSARAGKLVGALGIQLHGGIGMTEEYPVGHYFRYLTAFEKTFGDLDFHLRRMINN